MKKQVYEVDAQGFIHEIYVWDFENEGNPAAPLPENYVPIDPPHGLYKAKWTGMEWVEGKTQAEFEKENMANALKPNHNEVEKAEFELKVINTLMEVGLL